MVEFQTTYAPAYAHPMDREYMGNNSLEPGGPSNIEKPIVPINEIGQSVTEGSRFGSLIDTTKAAIGRGTGSVELATIMGGGGEPGGAESYGKDAREALRELSKVNEVSISSIHTPTNIGNLSGFNPQQGNFSDDFRKVQIDEVKKAIKFAGDVGGGGSVVVHTGEFNRPMFDAKWNKDKQFVSYEEEEQRAVKPLVDERTGRVISEVRMNQVVPRAVWNKYEPDNKELWEKYGGKEYVDERGNVVRPGDYVHYEEYKLERAERVPRYNKDKNTFDVQEVKWDYFQKEADDMNKEKEQQKGRPLLPNEVITPEEAFLYATTETQEKIARGWAGTYGDRLRDYFKKLDDLKKAREFYVNLESNTPEEEKWKLIKTFEEKTGLMPPEKKMPVEFLDEQIRDVREAINHTKEMVTGQLQSATEQKILREHSMSAKRYALKKSMESYAEVGIYAMKESSNNPHANRDIFVAPENIFPEMGYGSHPEELIELVQNARGKMVEFLTSKYIDDPSGRRDAQTGDYLKVPNPHYTGMSEEQARKEAEQHIKATFDTQHLGMWWKNFTPKEGETEEQRRSRFNVWFMDEVKKMEESNIIGNIHLVDSLGGGHHHLPAGQGDLPVVEAIKYLKKKGYKGAINSEGHEEERMGQGRILVETWRAFGSPIYRTFAPSSPTPGSWNQVHQGYFGRTMPPLYIFGAYSPSNDWTLWSQAPME